MEGRRDGGTEGGCVFVRVCVLACVGASAICRARGVSHRLLRSLPPSLPLSIHPCIHLPIRPRVTLPGAVWYVVDTLSIQASSANVEVIPNTCCDLSSAFEIYGGNPQALRPTSYTRHPTPCARHPTPYTLHPTSNTPHPTPYTLHPTPYARRPTPLLRPQACLRALWRCGESKRARLGERKRVSDWAGRADIFLIMTTARP